MIMVERREQCTSFYHIRTNDCVVDLCVGARTLQRRGSGLIKVVLLAIGLFDMDFPSRPRMGVEKRRRDIVRRIEETTAS